MVSLPAWHALILIPVLICFNSVCPGEDMVGTQDRLLKDSDGWPQVDADRWADVLSETQQSWKRLKAQTVPWRAHIVRTFRYLNSEDQSITGEDRVEFDLNGNAQCLLLTKKKQQDIDVVGVNEQYVFRLHGTQNKGDRHFEIAYMGDDQREADEARDILFSPIKMAGIDALELTKSDGFKIQRVQQGQGTDSHCVRIDFLSSYSPREQIEVTGGYFIADTALNCAICECRIETFDGKIHDADHLWFQVDTNRFVTSAGVVPMVSQSSSGIVGHPAHILAAEETQRLRPADLSRGDCSLSAFGFPEPPQQDNSYSRWNTGMGLKILAVVLCVVGYVYLSRRLTTTIARIHDVPNNQP